MHLESNLWTFPSSQSEAVWSESSGRWEPVFFWAFVGKHQHFKSDAGGYKTPVEGIEQWSEIEGRLNTAAFWLIYRVPVARKGRTARSYVLAVVQSGEDRTLHNWAQWREVANSSWNHRTARFCAVGERVAGREFFREMTRSWSWASLICHPERWRSSIIINVV